MQTSEEFQRGYAAAMQFALIADRTEIRAEANASAANVRALDAAERRTA